MKTVSHTMAWLIAVLLALTPTIVRADAGTVRISQRHGDRQITVFTDPTPLRAGPLDVSVLVQDVATGSVAVDDLIEISVAPRGQPSLAVTYQAGRAATNALFQTAHFNLPRAGEWEFTISVKGADKTAEIPAIAFMAAAAEPLPPWQAVWPWFCWPFAVVVLFVFRKFAS